MKPLNPFIWDRPVPPERFIGRKKEISIIVYNKYVHLAVQVTVARLQIMNQ